jgi:hypothetical protein
MAESQRLENLGRKLSTARIGALLFSSVLAVYLLTASGRIDSGDGLTIFAVSQSLLDDGDVTIAPSDPELMAFDAQGRPLGKAADLGIEDGYSIRGRDGRYYSHYGIGHSLLLLPFLVLGRLAASTNLLGPPQWTLQFVASMLFNPMVSAGSGLLVYHAGRRLGFSLATSVLVAILYAFGTMTWVYAKSFFSDPLVAFFLLMAFYSLLSYRHSRKTWWLWIGSSSLGLAILTKPGSLIHVPILAAYLLYVLMAETRRVPLECLVAFAVPLAVGLAGTMAYNWWRFGSLLDTGYRNVSWAFPFFKGLYGLVASPGKGYLLYNPISVGAIIGGIYFFRRHRPEFWVCVGMVVTNLVFLAKYDHWHGGGSWGPRLLLPITPFVILFLGSLLEKIPRDSPINLGLAALIALSIIIQIPGVSVNYVRFLQRVYDLSDEQYYQRVTFEVPYSPLIGQWAEMREVVGNLRDPGRRVVISELAFGERTDGSAERAMQVLSANLPDFWFIYLRFILGNS